MVSSISTGTSPKKHNEGKLIGTGIGTAAAGYSAYKAFKTIDTSYKFISSEDTKNAINEGNIDKFKSLIEQSKTLSKKTKESFLSFIERTKNSPEKFTEGMKNSLEFIEKMKNHKVVAIGVGSIPLIVGGLGLGTIIDFISNSIDKHKQKTHAN